MSDGSDRWVDYLPLLALLGFWLQAAVVGSLLSNDLRLVALGVVTLPALAALGLAAREVRRRHKAAERKTAA
jgi:sulfite exporter TauE/SafE